MPGRRNLILANNEIYHIYNKTVGNEEIFTKTRSIKRFLDSIEYYQFKQPLKYSHRFKINPLLTPKNNSKTKLIELYAYAIMPNHFHLLLKQLSDNGIRKYLAILQNSFAKYHNLRNDRKGGLFIRPFKAKRVENDKLFLHISRYVHLNPTTSYLLNIDQLTTSNLTSLPFYLNEKISKFSPVNPKLVLSLSGSRENYLKFIQDREDYQKKLQIVKYLSFD